MIIALKQDRDEEEKTEWINSHLPVFLYIILGIIALSFVLRVIRNLLWVRRLGKRQKHFQECVEVYNECGISDKKYQFKTEQDRLLHQTAQQQSAYRERYWYGSVGQYGAYIVLELADKYRDNPQDETKADTGVMTDGNLLQQMKKRVRDEEGSDSIAVGVELPQECRTTQRHTATRSVMIIGEKFEDTKDRNGHHAMYDSDAISK